MEDLLAGLKETDCFYEVKGAAMQVRLAAVFAEGEEPEVDEETGPVDVYFLADGNALVYSRDYGLIAWLEGVNAVNSEDTEE